MNPLRTYAICVTGLLLISHCNFNRLYRVTNQCVEYLTEATATAKECCNQRRATERTRLYGVMMGRNP